MDWETLSVPFETKPTAEVMTWEDFDRFRRAVESKRIRPHVMPDGSHAYIFDLKGRRFVQGDA